MHAGVFEVFLQFCKENPSYDCVLEITYSLPEKEYEQYRDMFFLVAQNGGDDGWHVSQKRQLQTNWCSPTFFSNFDLQNLHNYVCGIIEKFEIRRR
jgi:hypothetical protein